MSLAVSGLSTVSSDVNKNCWFELNTIRPVLISIPSNSSEGNIEAADISIGSLADVVSADSAKKSGFPNVPGLDSITFSPDNSANLLRKNSTLLILPIKSPLAFVSINDGNLIVASGHGIDFSASGGPSGTGNELLDDYEEGTFTPYFSFSPTDVTNETYSIQTGHYVKVGRIVFFRLEVQLSNKGTLSSGAGWCQIGGLPIQSSDYAGVSIGIYQHFNNVQPGIASVGTNEQVYIAYDPSLNNNTSSYDLQHTHLRDNSRINISGTYYASS